jgi:hypothetical protein
MKAIFRVKGSSDRVGLETESAGAKKKKSFIKTYKRFYGIKIFALINEPLTCYNEASRCLTLPK